MKKHTVVPLLSLIVLVVASLACGGSKTPAQPEETAPPTEAPVVAPTEPPALPSPTPVAEEAEEQPQTDQTDQGDYDTAFPLPDDVQNFTGGGGEEMVNFQTSLSLEEVVEFYRQSLTEQGLTEREILTVIEDEAFSMVFDGWSNGQALVIQGVDLGETTNVNMRLEDV